MSAFSTFSISNCSKLIFERKELSNKPHAEWFNQNYLDYNLDKETLNKLKPLFKDIEITVFMGTWCSDSRKEIPVFFKLIDMNLCGLLVHLIHQNNVLLKTVLIPNLAFRCRINEPEFLLVGMFI